MFSFKRCLLQCSPIRCMVKFGGVEPVESVAQRFAEETGLKLKFAMMWLEEAGVDYQRALKEFEEAKAEGKINPEGFEEKWVTLQCLWAGTGIVHTAHTVYKINDAMVVVVSDLVWLGWWDPGPWLVGWWGRLVFASTSITDRLRVAPDASLHFETSQCWRHQCSHTPNPISKKVRQNWPNQNVLVVYG